jgi:hypothetical protein
MLLERYERSRFLEWLKTQARTSDVMATQLSDMSVPAMAEMSKREKQKAIAFTIVANVIESAEPFDVE